MKAPGTLIWISSHLRRLTFEIFCDILILSNKEDEHMEHRKKVCRNLKGAPFFGSRKKSEFFSSKMNNLSQVVDDNKTSCLI